SVPEEYTIAFPYGIPLDLIIDGSPVEVFVDGWMNEYAGFDTLVVSCGNDSVEMDVEAFSICPLYINIADENYLYVQMSEMNDCSEIYVYRLSAGDSGEGAAEFVGSIYADWFSWVDDAEDGGDYISIEYPLINPYNFCLTSHTDVLSTARGFKYYRVGDDGMPETDDEYYLLTDQYVLTLERSLTVERITDDFESDGEMTLSAGTQLTYMATDGEGVCILQLPNGTYVRLFVEHDYDNYDAPTVDGISIFDLFTGLVFAG
ncbi:MAG: hypothetical protein IK064_05945, partial [Clostridia bacterium]|nr:hypothetical protein [Clostridia bacterium]